MSRDCQSVTARNLKLVENEAGCSPWDYSRNRFKSQLKKIPVPENDEWRLTLLLKLLEKRRLEENLLNDTKRLTKMIDSLSDS